MGNSISKKLASLISMVKTSNEKWTDLYSKLSVATGGKKQWQNFDFPSVGKMLAFMEMLRIEKQDIQTQFLPLEYVDIWNQLRYSFSYIKDGKVNNGNPSSDWDMLQEFIEVLYDHFQIPFDKSMVSMLNEAVWQQKERYYRSVVEKSLSANITVTVSDE